MAREVVNCLDQLFVSTGVSPSRIDLQPGGNIIHPLLSFLMFTVVVEWCAVERPR